MPRLFAIISEGKVEGVIVAQPEFIETLNKTAIEVTEMENRPGPGWAHDGEKFVEPIQEKTVAPEKQEKQDAIDCVRAIDLEKLPTEGEELQILLKQIIKAII